MSDAVNSSYAWIKKTRYTEKYLLRSVYILLFLLSLSGVSLTTSSLIQVFGPLILISLAGYCTHIWLSAKGNQGDELVFPIVLLLIGMGWVFVRRVRPELGARHFISIMVGLFGLNLVAMSALSSKIKRHVYSLLGLTLGLLIVTVLFGTEYGGSRGWLDLGLFTIQPAEFARLVFVLFAAELLSRHPLDHKWSRKRYLVIIGAVWIMISVLFALQNDFGTLFVMTSAFIVMLYVSLDRLSVLVVGVMGAFALLGVAYRMVPHVTLRINNWINPWESMYSQGFQLVQSLFGFGNGGLFGVGLGLGRSASIPAAHTDLVFSVIHEELGFLGAIAVIMLYLILTYRGFRIVLQCSDKYQQLMAVGICTMLAFQVIAMIAGSTGLFPLSGLIMPFLSFGGTGMATNLVMVGMLLGIPITNTVGVQRKNVLYVLAMFLAGFLVCISYLTYIQVFRVSWLWDHPANMNSGVTYPVQVLDRYGCVLVDSSKQVGLNHTTYNVPKSLGHTVGYANSKYGASGVYGTFQRDLLRLTQHSFLSKIGVNLGFRQREDWVVSLNIDLTLQQAAERALTGKRGAIVVVNPYSGDILASASSPGFDPATLEEVWDGLVNDPNAPFFNRATYGLYPPGSLFKIVVAAAAVDLGIVLDEEQFVCEQPLAGTVESVCCINPHGALSLREAFAVSCNRVFVDLAHRIGGDALLSYARKFGFGQPLEYSLGCVASKVSSSEHIEGAELALMAIGQGEVLVTPLHMALVTSAIANGGNLVRPQLVFRIQDTTGRIAYTCEPEVLSRAISTKTSAIIRDMMLGVVSDGTGKAAQIEGYAVAGKTGTAETQGREPHSWFVGFVPADSPEFCIAVIVENAGRGGDIAAPIAQSILNCVLEN